MTQAADIAIVFFDRFINGDAIQKRAVAQEVYDAFSSVGWVYIADHGIPQTRVDEVFGLVCASKCFHELIDLQRIRLNHSSIFPYSKSLHGDLKMR